MKTKKMKKKDSNISDARAIIKTAIFANIEELIRIHKAKPSFQIYVEYFEKNKMKPSEISALFLTLVLRNE